MNSIAHTEPIQLKIINLNINSIISKHKRIQLSELLKISKPDIVLLTETKIKPAHKITFTDYEFIRNDRLTDSGGGTAIIIKSNIAYEAVNTPSNIEHLELSLIKIPLKDKRFLYVGSWYNAPGRTLIQGDIYAVLNEINNSSSNNFFILGGDLNARHQDWFNTVHNNSGKRLKTIVDKTPQIKLLHTMEPTHKDSFLDFFLIHFKLNVEFPANHASTYLKCLPVNISDHHAVELIINLTTHNGNALTIQHNDLPILFSYKKANWKKFRAYSSHVASRNDEINIPNNKNLSVAIIDKQIDKITDLIKKAMQKCIPKFQPNKIKHVDLPSYILNLLKEKHRLCRKLHRIFLHTGNKQHAEYITTKSLLKCLESMVKNAIDAHLQSNWETKLRNIKYNADMYKNIKTVLGNTSFDKIPTLQLNTNGNNLLICNDTDKANLFGKHFESVHLQNNLMGNKQFTNDINSSVHRWLHSYTDEYIPAQSNIPIQTAVQFSNKQKSDAKSPVLPYFTTPSHLAAILKTVNNKKSSGYDDIPNAVLKQLPPSIIRIICILFNNCLNLCYFPEKWKIAQISPIRKPNKSPIYIANYRPISLLPCLGKLFEKIINQWLTVEIDKLSIIPDSQFGFRPHHSTIHAVLTFREDIIKALANKHFTVACLLDVEKAFDTVWTKGLIWKLRIKFNISEALCLLINNYLQSRQFFVMVNKKKSNLFQIRARVPQGAIISPTLYSLYSADIPTNSRSYFQPSNTEIKTIQYADDTIIYNTANTLTEATDNVNKHLQQVQQYFDLWKIKLNTDKCVTIIIRNPSPTCGKNILAREKNVVIKINQNIIQNVKQVKYLGIHLTNLFKNFAQVKHSLKKAYYAKHILYPVLNVNSGVNKKIKIMCYKQLIRPQLTYGFPIWFHISKPQMEKLKICERKCLRQCINFQRTPDSFKYIANKKLYEDTNIVPIDRYNFNLLEKFIEKLQYVPNQNISKIINEMNNHAYLQQYINTQKYIPTSAVPYMKSIGLIYNTEEELILYK